METVKNKMDTVKITINTRKDLIYWLSQASELEHTLCCAYLYSAYTIKDSLDENGIKIENLEDVKKWKSTIFLVAAQEMYHLTQASNLLMSIGAKPHFQRPIFPINSKHYPDHVPIELAPFSTLILKRFICIERPEVRVQGKLDDQYCFDSELTKGASPDMTKDDVITVGELYSSIYAGFVNLVKKYGDEKKVFIGSKNLQLGGNETQFSELIQVVDLKSARDGIEKIVEQGEGTPNDIPDSHFGAFQMILREYTQHLSDKEFHPIRPSVCNPSLNPNNLNTTLITNPFTCEVAKIFNEVYELMLICLYSFFTSDKNDTTYQYLMGLALNLMTVILKPLGEYLTKLPLDDSKSGKTAGPSFELNPNYNQLSFSKDVVMTMIHERLSKLSENCSEINKKNENAILKSISNSLSKFSDGF